jgi:hypothetical protein
VAEGYTNNATGLLDVGIDDDDASLDVGTGEGAAFPTANFVVRVDDELIEVSSRTGDTLTLFLRGAEGTVAASHSAGATVAHVLTAGSLTRVISDSMQVVTNVGQLDPARGHVARVLSGLSTDEFDALEVYYDAADEKWYSKPVSAGGFPVNLLTPDFVLIESDELTVGPLTVTSTDEATADEVLTVSWLAGRIPDYTNVLIKVHIPFVRTTVVDDNTLYLGLYDVTNDAMIGTIGAFSGENGKVVTSFSWEQVAYIGNSTAAIRLVSWISGGTSGRLDYGSGGFGDFVAVRMEVWAAQGQILANGVIPTGGSWGFLWDGQLGMLSKFDYVMLPYKRWGDAGMHPEFRWRSGYVEYNPDTGGNNFKTGALFNAPERSINEQGFESVHSLSSTPWSDASAYSDTNRFTPPAGWDIASATGVEQYISGWYPVAHEQQMAFVQNFDGETGSGTGSVGDAFTLDALAALYPAVLLIAVFTWRDDSTSPNTPTLTQTGVTWTQVADLLVDSAGTDRCRVTVFRSYIGSTPGDLAIDLDLGAGTHKYAVRGLRLVDVDTGGTNGANAVLQYTTDTQDDDTALAPTFGSAMTANTTVVSFVAGTASAFFGNNSTTPDRTVLISDASANGESGAMTTLLHPSDGDTTPTYGPLTGDGSEKWGVVAIELQSDAAISGKSNFPEYAALQDVVVYKDAFDYVYLQDWRMEVRWVYNP